MQPTSSPPAGGHRPTPATIVLSVAAGVVIGGGLLQALSSKAAETKIIESSRKSARLSDAKFVGEAVLLYAGDFDDMPPSAAGYKEQLRPYLPKEYRNLVDSFIWDLPSGASTRNPGAADLKVGHFHDDFGDTFVYLDGHSRLEMFPAK